MTQKANRIVEQIAVVTAKDIEQISPQTSADILTAVPGIKVQKSQFGGGSPVLRGMESNRVLLVVDGVRMNNAIYRKGHLQNAITVKPQISLIEPKLYLDHLRLYMDPMLWEVLFTTIQKTPVYLLIRRLTQIFLIDFHLLITKLLPMLL